MQTMVKQIGLSGVDGNAGNTRAQAWVVPVIARGRAGVRGFTLIELMIVLAIAALLAAVAIPSYRNHVIKSNRAAAEAFMLQIANMEEQYLLNARAYTDVLGSGGLNLTPPEKVGTNYTFGIATTPTTYVITATPTAAQNDTLCGTLTLNQAGQKGASGSNCW